MLYISQTFELRYKTNRAVLKIKVGKQNLDNLWYFSNGSVYPNHSSENLNLLFADGTGDRITEQLMYLPKPNKDHTKIFKKILPYDGLNGWVQKPGTSAFERCPVTQCILLNDSQDTSEADAILFQTPYGASQIQKLNNQIWILYLLECPYHTPGLTGYNNTFNWTATYRYDSDLVAPYEKWVYYNPEVTQKPQDKDYAANKTKKVAWFVSNCAAQNGRLDYARELGKYIQVDIYGSCGSLECPRNDLRCFKILQRDYKFYLAFENSNCRDYITEKFYVNGLGHSVVPIVMGARPEDYKKCAPQGSYIHVDDFNTPMELAAFLHRLDKDDDIYNSYFRWKGTGEFINTYFWCRLCAMLHSPYPLKNYEDINAWWRGPGMCTEKSWRNVSH